MKRIIIGLVSFIIFFFSVRTAQAATTFFDDFNDGNAEGWWLGYSLEHPWVLGNWRVEEERLVQDANGDSFAALIDNNQYSSQIIETQIGLYGNVGYGGVVLWFQDVSNWVVVHLSPAYQLVTVWQSVGGAWTQTTYPYVPSSAYPTLDSLKIEANSVSGNLAVYLNNSYLFTHTVTTTNRTGQSGVLNGNNGGYFDNFTVSELTTPASKKDCKKDGWEAFNWPVFSNQGGCISYTQESLAR